ncbi:GTPase RsgA, partial [Streptomyces sp. NPDC046685]
MFNASLNTPSPSDAQHVLAAYGWDAAWEAEFTPYAEQGLLPGRVVRVDRGQ